MHKFFKDYVLLLLFTLVTQGYSCTTANCQTCDSGNICQSCVTGYILTDSCQSCNDGYRLDGGQCLDCNPWCETCVTFNNCTSCFQGLTYLNTTTSMCEVCSSPCLSCLAVDNCISCINTTFYLAPATTNQKRMCQSCSTADTQCLTCSELNGNFNCLTCNSGYFVLNGRCSQCGIRCTNCILNSNQCTTCAGNRSVTPQCTTCPPGFYDVSTTVNCAQCNLNYCTTCTGTATSCTTCAANRVTPPACTCRVGTYPSGDSCVTCMANCAQCTGPAQCTFCNSGYFYKINECVQTCGTTFFRDINNQVCTPCPVPNCLTCTSLATNGCSDCNTIANAQKDIQNEVCNSTTCKLNLHLNSFCYLKCPPGYYAGSNNVCQICDKSCAQCTSGTSNDCTVCNDQNWLHTSTDSRTQITSNKCLQACPTGFYKDVSRLCKICDSSCSDCSGPGDTQCQGCPSGKYLFTLSSSPSTGRCQSDCGINQGYFANPQRNTCDACSVNCLSCTLASETSCLTCKPAFFYQGTSCLSACNQGFYADSNLVCQACNQNCKTCKGPTSSDCLSCGTSIFLDQAKFQCSTACPDYTFGRTDTFVCDKCITGCLKCNNPTNCQYCDDKYFLNQNQNINTCVPVCPDGFYGDTTARACRACDPDCKICTAKTNSNCNCKNSAQTNSDCLQCNNGKFLYQNACLNQCPAGTFLNTANNNCGTCRAGCAVCTGDGEGFCTSCEQGYLFHNNNCLLNCPAGTFKSASRCLNCYTNCSSCSDNQSCAMCNNNSFLLNNSCATSCSSGMYGDALSRTCKRCDSACLTCRNGANTDCLSCPTSSFLFIIDKTSSSGNCLASCPNLFFANSSNNQCENCPSTPISGSSPCLTCTNATQCSSCPQGSFLSPQSQCISQCPTGFFANNSTRQCGQCANGCATCIGSLAKQCQSCTSLLRYYNFECTPRCPDGTYSQCADGAICQETTQNPNGNNCLLCQTDCRRCRDGTTACLACVVGKFFNSLNPSAPCVTTCPLRYYADASTSECLSCSTGCTRCTGPADTQCTACDNSLQVGSTSSKNYQLLNGRCLEVCPDTPIQLFADRNSNSLNYFCTSRCPVRTYADLPTKVCLNCDSSCLSCNGTKNSNCITCDTGRVLFNNSCSESCPSSTYLELSSQRCRDCNSNCLTCSGLTNCTSCRIGMFLQNGSCLSACSSGYYASSFTCLQCDINCITCDGPSQSNCLTFQTCPRGEFEVESKEGNLCQPCDEKCKSCTTTKTNCSSCFSKTYLQDGSCVEKCSIGYYANDSNLQCDPCYQKPDFTISLCSECEGSKENQCTACIKNNYLLNGICLSQCPVGFYGDEQLGSCSFCNKFCLTCNGHLINNCLTCSTDLFYFQARNQCYFQCPSRSYLDMITGTCISCDTSCDTCSGTSSNQCLSCSPNDTPQTYLDLTTKPFSCVSDCGTGYFGNPSTLTCNQCSFQCQNCVETSRKCTGECAGNRVTDGSGICPCPSGTQTDATTATCPQCYYRCLNCINAIINCGRCAGNRNQDPPFCTCPSGYFDDTLNLNPECIPCAFKCATCYAAPSTCISCRGNRVGSNCECPAGTYEDEKSDNCPVCDATCSTCSLLAVNCQSCRGNRLPQALTSESPFLKCLCQTGSYEDNKSTNCPNCDFKCSGCIQSSSNCESCKEDRITPPLCICPAGFYHDNVNDKCQKCDLSCLTCDIKGCLTCAGNREGPNSQFQCVCPPNGMDRRVDGSSFCSTCNLGVPFFKLQDNLQVLTIQFESTPTVKGINDPQVPSNDMCQRIFSSTDYQNLGTGVPFCNVNPQNVIQILVQFGTNSTMGPGYNITLRGGSLGRSDCGGAFQSAFMPGIIQPPDSPPKAQVRFIGPQMINLCSRIFFYPGQFINDGGRGLTMVAWTIKSMTPENAVVRQKILQIFAAAQASKNPKIEIPPLTLSENGNYVFRYNFTNFLGTMFYNDYTLLTTTFESPFVEIQQLAPFIFVTSARIQLTAVILHQSCISGTVELIENEVKYIWSQSSVAKTSESAPNVEGNNILSNTTTLVGVKRPNITYVSINIPPFSGYGGYEYTITLTATLSNKPVSADHSVKVTLITQPLQTGIAGGNRMNGFSVPLKLDGWAQDPNIQFNQSAGITPVWSCINLNTNAECKDGNDDTLVYNLSSFNQTIKAKSLVAYNAYNFYLNVTKASLNQFAVAQAVIVIVELDLPVLEMNSPAYVSSQTVNLNMDMKFTLDYDVKNPDAIFYGGALVYNYDVVQTMKFQFTNFSITLWDLFSNFTNLTQITFRASVYDPRYFMPSTNSITIDINLPPTNCKLSVEPSSGISFNQKFQIVVSGCTDPDSPLTYKFGYYFSPEHYIKDILAAKTLNYNLLVDFSVETSLTTILPQPLSLDSDLENPFILLIATVSDSLGGIANLTSKIVTGSNQVALDYNKKIAETSKTRLLQESEQNITKKLEQRTRIPRYYRLRQLGEVQHQISTLTALYNDMGSLRVYETINMLNLLGTGSGGIPIPEPSSYISDEEKAQARADAANLLTLKQNILKDLKIYQTQDVSQPTKESIVKSISFLNSQPDIQGTYTSADIYDQLVTIDKLILSCGNQLDQINSDIEKGRIDVNQFRIKQSLNNNLDRSLELIDNVLVAQHDSISTILAELASQSTAATDSTTTTDNTTKTDNTTATDNTTTIANSTTTNSTTANLTNTTNDSSSSEELAAARRNNEYMLSLITKFKTVVVRAFNPNGPPSTFGGTGFQLKTNKATPSIVAQYFGGLDLTKEASSTKLSVDDEAVASSNETVVPFTFLQFQFELNPYATDSDYPNPDSSQPVQGVELAYPNGTIFVPKQPLPLNYDVQTAATTSRRQLRRLQQRTSRHNDERHARNLQFIQDLYSIEKPLDLETTSCTSKVGGAWKSNACQLIQEEQAGGVLQITCKCDNLHPTSIGSTIGDALQLDKFGKAFSAAAILALLNFPFHKSVLVYAIAFMTTALVICVYYGMKKDFLEAQSKILPVHFVESEYIRIITEEEMEKRQAIIDRDIQREKEKLEKLEKEQTFQKKSTESQDLKIQGSSQAKGSSTQPINLEIEVQEIPPIEPVEVKPDIDPDELYAIMQANKKLQEIQESDSDDSSSDSEHSYEYARPFQQPIYGQPDQEENIILRKQDEYDLYFDSSISVQKKSKSSILEPQHHQIKINVQQRGHQAIQIENRQVEDQPFKKEIKNDEDQEEEIQQQQKGISGEQIQVQVSGEEIGQYMGSLNSPPDFDQSEIPVVRRQKSQSGFSGEVSNQQEAYEQTPIANQFGSESSRIPINEDQQQEKGSGEQQDMLGEDQQEASQDPNDGQQEAQNEIEVIRKQVKKRTKKFKKKNYKIDVDAYDEAKEPLYEIKEQLVKDYIRRKKREAFEKSNKRIEFNLRNLIIFFCLFHNLLAIFFLFEKKLPRAIRFSVLYMTILNTCYINIFFQVPLDPVQSIIFSIASAILSAIEMFVITFLMPHKFICLRMLGWMLFIGITLLLIWFILTSMALEAADSNGDVSRSNAWGINFILGFMNTHLVSDPVKLVIMFKALQVSLNAAQGPIQKILVMAFVNAGSNLFFEELH